MLSYAALAAGAAFFFLLRRAGPAPRERTLFASLAGVAVSAAVAVAERWGIGPGETSGYWKIARPVVRRRDGPERARDPLRPRRRRRRGPGGARTGAPARSSPPSLSRSWRPGSSCRARAAASRSPGSASSRCSSRAGRGRAAAPPRSSVRRRSCSSASRSCAFPTGPGSAGERLAQIFDGRLPVDYRASARPILWASAVRLFAQPSRRGRGPRRLFLAAAEPAGRAGAPARHPRQPGQRVPAGARRDRGHRPRPDGGPGVRARARGVGGPARPRRSAGRGAGSGAAVLGFLVALLTGSHWFAPDAAFLFFLLAAVTARGQLAERPPVARRRRRCWWRSTRPRRSSSALARAGPTRPFATAPEIGFHEREIRDRAARSPGPSGASRCASSPGRTQQILLAHYTPEGRERRAHGGGGRPDGRLHAHARGRPGRCRCGSPRAPATRGTSGFTLSRAFVPRRLGVSGDRRELGRDRRVPAGADVEFQFHPASRQAARAHRRHRRARRAGGDRGGRARRAARGVAWITVPAGGFAGRCAREHSASIAEASAAVHKDYRDVEARAAGLRERALDARRPRQPRGVSLRGRAVGAGRAA